MSSRTERAPSLFHFYTVMRHEQWYYTFACVFALGINSTTTATAAAAAAAAAYSYCCYW